MLQDEKISCGQLQFKLQLILNRLIPKNTFTFYLVFKMIVFNDLNCRKD